MAEHTVLLVDADTALSERVQAALSSRGCASVILADAAALLDDAAMIGTPSAIVLCIDPKRQGWQSCMRIRKHAAFQHVPLLVTSAEATAQDFDEHRKLKTRADAYVHKPFEVEQLVGQVLSQLGAAAPLDALDVEEVELDDAIIIEENDGGGFGGEATRVAGFDFGADPDAAFDQLAAAGPAPVAASGEVDLLRTERDRLQHELESLRSRPAERASAVPREMLALREVIVGKDREVAELKEAIDGKDREILDTRDRMREAERARRALDEKLLSVERELVDAQERIDTMTQEAQQAAAREHSLGERLDETRRALERTQADLEAARRDHEARQAATAIAHAEEKQALAARHDAERAELQQRIAAGEAAVRERDADKARLVEEHERALNERDRTHGESTERLRQEHAATLAAAADDKAQALAAAADDKTQALAAAAEEKAQALAAAKDDKFQALGRAQVEREQALAAAAKEHADAVAALRAAHADELRAAALRFDERTAELQATREQLAAHQAESTARIDALTGENTGLQEQVLKAYHRVKGDEQVVARARKALAIALTLLDESIPAAKEEPSS